MLMYPFWPVAECMSSGLWPKQILDFARARSNEALNESINQSIHQSINHSINQLTLWTTHGIFMKTTSSEKVPFQVVG